MDCPSEDRLIDYALGKLDDCAWQDISQHLVDCVSCLSVIDRSDCSEDPLLKSIREEIPAALYIDQPEYKSVYKAILEIGSRFGANSIDSPKSKRADLPPGSQLGEYCIVGKLGSGGMGTVYEVEHIRLKSKRALKIADPESAARFARETAALGQLRHDNLVLAHDAGKSEEHSYLVMERIHGLDLGQLNKRLGPLPIADACEIIRQACMGLQYVHERGLVHRDIKPSNVMLSIEGIVKILDLGLAYSEAEANWNEEVTCTGQILGSTAYMAPEQGMGNCRVDIRADIYSLGCTFYCLLTNKPPFSGSKLDVILAHRTEEPQPLAELRPDIPTELCSIVERMMAKRANERHPVPVRVAEDLISHCAGHDLLSLVTLAKQREANSHVTEAQHTTPPVTSSPLLDTDAKVFAQENKVRQSYKTSEPKVKGQSAGLPNRPRPWMLVLGMGGIFLFAMGIIFTIKFQDGEESVVHVPVGSEATITAQGDVTVAPAGDTGGTEAAKSSASPTQQRSIENQSQESTSPDKSKSTALVLDGKSDIERAVAEWVIQRKGTVKIWYHGTKIFSRLEELPEEKFLIDAISLWGVREHTPADLEKLSNVSNLRFLSLGNSHVSDESLAAISKSRNLTWLQINRGKYSQQGIAHLKALPRLSYLSMGYADIDKQSIQHLPKFRRLTMLNLNEASLSDIDIAPLAAMRQLERLELESNRITDVGVASLASLPNLSSLNLSYNPISDKCVSTLKNMSQLSALSAKGTELTNTAIEELATALPECEIKQ